MAMVYLSYFLVQMSMKGNSMLASLYSVSLGADTTVVSLVIACYSLMPLLCSVWTGQICDRIGNRLPICFGTLCCGGALLIPALIRQRLFAVVMSQLFFGLGHVMFQIAMQNLIGKLSDEHNRAGRFSMLSVVMATGNMVAPILVGGAIDVQGFSVSYGLCSGFSMVAFVVIVLFFATVKLPPQTAGEHTKRPQGFSLALLQDRQRQKMLLTSATIMTGSTLFSFYIPLYGNQLGFSATEIGVLSGTYAAAFFVVRLMFPALTKRHTGVQILQGALLLSSMGYLALSLSRSYHVLAVICFVIGLGLGCGNPLTMNIAYQVAPPGQSGEVLGLRLMANRLTQIVLPVLTGAIFPSYRLVFVGLAAFLGGSSFVYSGAARKQAPPTSKKPSE